MNAKNRNKTPSGVFKNGRASLKQPTSGNDELPAKSAAPKTKTKTKRTTNVEVGIIVNKLSLINRITTAMDNNNEFNVEATDLSDLDVLDQTTIEIELSGNEPSILNDSVVLEMPEEETSPEEHSTEPNENNAQVAETNDNQPRYVFQTVEGGSFIIQGTSDGRIEMVTPDQGGNLIPQRNSGSENETEETVAIVQPVATGNTKEVTADERERDYQNVMKKGKELTVLLNQIESATDKTESNANNNDLNGNLNPTPEASEIPVMEEHDTDLENANQQAWENRSANQKKYLETLEAGRTRRKLIL